MRHQRTHWIPYSARATLLPQVLLAIEETQQAAASSYLLQHCGRTATHDQLVLPVLLKLMVPTDTNSRSRLTKLLRLRSQQRHVPLKRIAVQGMTQLHDGESIDLLLELLNDPDAATARLANEGLVELSGQSWEPLKIGSNGGNKIRIGFNKTPLPISQS